LKIPDVNNAKAVDGVFVQYLQQLRGEKPLPDSLLKKWIKG
jgi:hypothetical protein